MPTSAPASARARAISRPMRRAPPVTNAALPFNSPAAMAAIVPCGLALRLLDLHYGWASVAGMEQLKKIYRAARWLMLAATVITGFLALKNPTPVAETLSPALVKQNAESFQQKLTKLANAQSSGETGAEVHFTAPEVNAAIGQATFPQPTVAGPTPASEATPEAAAAQVPIKSTQVSFEDDVVKGQF